MRLKRWESPRKQGRNDKGKGGTARKRQLKKRQQMLRKKLKGNRQDNDSINRQGEEKQSSPCFFINFYTIANKIHNDNSLVKYKISYLN